MDNSSTWLDRFLAFLEPKTAFLQPGIMKCRAHYPPKAVPFQNHDNRARAYDYSCTVSIVIPNLNQGSYLGKAIQSVLNQNYPQLECIVIDGGSTDESVDVIKDYSNSISWWCSEPDSGQTEAINKGFAHTNGEIMAWLNADDMLVPGTINRVVEYLASNKKVDVVYGHRILVNEQDQEIGRWVLPPHNHRILAWSDFIPQETLFWRRSLWEKVGSLLDESFHFAMDWDLLLRFRAAGATMVRLPFFLGLFRIHPSQKTRAEMAETGEKEMTRLRVRSLGYSPTKNQITVHTLNYLLEARLLEVMIMAGLITYE